MPGINISVIIVAWGNDDCSDELLHNEVDNVCKAWDITGVRIPGDVVLDGKVVRKMLCHGHVVRRIVPGDAEKPFLKVILIACLIDLRRKQRPGVGAGEVDE